MYMSHKYSFSIECDSDTVSLIFLNVHVPQIQRMLQRFFVNRMEVTLSVCVINRRREDYRRELYESSHDAGMGAEEKRKKTKIIPGTQPKARAGWPKRLLLVQATP